MRMSPQLRPSPPPVVIPPAFAERMAIRLAAEARVWLTPRVTSRMLLIAVGAEFGLRLGELTGPRRFPHFCRGRWAFAVLARQRLGLNRSETGRRLGGRDHTTALWAWKCGDALRQSDPAFAQSLARIEAALWPEGPPSPDPPVCGLRPARAPAAPSFVMASEARPSIVERSHA